MDQELLWNVDYRQFEFNGAITSKVFVEGNRMGSEGDLLSVFVNGECRGVVEALSSPFEENGYVFLLMAYSNEEEGEIMSFNYYDASAGKVYENIQEIEFEGNMVVGDAIDSYVVSYVETPQEYALGMAYPNPFNPSTNITFSLENDGYTNIAIYDIKGRLIDELINDFKVAGNYEITWNAVNNSSGVYFVVMNVNGYNATQKIMLVK